MSDKTDKLVGAFMKFARRFDEVSNGLLDKNMCTETCPCLSSLEYQQNKTDKHPYQIYSEISEMKANRHGRTRYK